MDSSTYNYYLEHSEEYANQTRQLDVTPFIRQFTYLLPPKAKIVDLGCAAGRDLKIFKQLGFDVQGVEVCPSLAQVAQEYSKCPVIISDISKMDMISDCAYDGIWVCATLVHTSPQELHITLNEIIRIAKPGATLFISVKEGEGSFKDDNDRLFFLYNQNYMKKILDSYSLECLVMNSSLGNNAKWLNIWGKLPRNGSSDEVQTTNSVAYSWGKLLLEQANFEKDNLRNSHNIANEARWILEYENQQTALTKDTHAELTNIFLDQEKILDITTEKRYFSAIRKRCQHCPLDYLLGIRNFCNLDFYVTTDVLIPRPETEIIVEYIKEQYAKENNSSILGLDLATGSGCIAISLLKYLPNIQMIASDISMPALEICKINAKRHQVEERLKILHSDLWQVIPNTNKFDFIVSNPPYISENDYPFLMPEVQNFEPKIALLGGKDGLDFYRNILAKASEYIKPNGLLVLEIGHDQADKILTFLPKELALKKILLDHQEIRRVLVFYKPLFS